MFGLRRAKARKRKANTPSSFWVHIIRGTLGIAAFGGLLYGIHYGTNKETFLIDEVRVEGGATISHDEIRSIVERELEGNYFGLIPRKFAYTYPREDILSALSALNHIRTLSIIRDRRDVLKISFEEYIPHALWCIPETCFFLDENGFAFAESPQLSGGSFIRYYTEGQSEIERGQVIDEVMLRDSEWFIEVVERELGFRIASVLYKQNKDVEFEVSGGGMFLTASGKDIRTTYANLKTVLTSDVYSHIEAGNFNYVDVRFDTKIFVNEEVTPEEEVTSTSTEALPE